MHAHITLMTFTQFAQNSTVGGTFALYGPMHVATLKPYIFRPDKAINYALLYEDIWTSFFCLVCRSLVEKKVKQLICGGIGSTWGHNFYMGTQNGILTRGIFDSRL